MLLIEFITGGGFAGLPLPAALAAEGEMMVRAVLGDAQAVAGLDITVVRDARMPALPTRGRVVAIDAAPWDAWDRCIRETDAVLTIAPETDGALERLNALVHEQGKLLLGCAPAAVSITASKRHTASRLSACGVSVVHTVPASTVVPPPSSDGWVLKPDDGAGSEQIVFAKHEAELHARIRALAQTNFVVQPFVPGEPMSLSLLCGTRHVRVIACNLQLRRCHHGELRQTGVIVNAAADRRAEMQPLAEQVAAAVPGLLGYVGVDLVDSGSGPIVLEVNPRLTTAYVGVSESTGVNALELMVRACSGDDSVMDIPLAARPVTVSTHA
jgi:predicted ATP-grasp superfamily ATP-dependent carboligase